MIQKTNHIALLVDRSSSTKHIAPEIIRQLNSQIEQIRVNSVREGQKTHVSLYTFSDVADRPLFFDVPLDLVDIKPLTASSYVVDGMTALFDSVGMAIEDLSQFHKETKGDHGFLVMVFTDGGENQSRKWLSTINQIMAGKVKSDMWTFVFSVPRGDKAALVSRYGIPEGNIQEWDVSLGSAGVRSYGAVQSQGLSNYFSIRSRGVRATSSFYTDLGSVSATELKSKLNDVTTGFQKRVVEKETEIRTFCEYKFGEYVLGCAFYELTKSEKVQDHKKIAIEDKATGKIYGSDNARVMLGFPTVGEIRVKPGNHANYRIYIQSTSVNRKLVRGTHVLYHKAGMGVGV